MLRKCMSFIVNLPVAFTRISSVLGTRGTHARVATHNTESHSSIASGAAASAFSALREGFALRSSPFWRIRSQSLVGRPCPCSRGRPGF